MRHSPDNADALAVLVEVSRRNGNTPTGKTARRDATSWMSAARKLDAANNTEEVEEDSGELFSWART
jgi:hypothetical protein